MIGLAVHLIEVLIGKIAHPQHEGISQQIAESEDVFREMRIRVSVRPSAG
jgi:hypothetical protein